MRAIVSKVNASGNLLPLNDQFHRDSRLAKLWRACRPLIWLIILICLPSHLAYARHHPPSASASVLQEVPASGPSATPNVAVQARLRPPPDGRPLPVGCSLSDVTSILATFVDSFNRGDEAMVVAAIPIEEGGTFLELGSGGFGWLADGQTDTMARTRVEVQSYVRDRHAHGDMMDLLQVDASGASWDSGVDFLFDIAREADDLSFQVVGGKGALDCSNRTIIVWSIGDRETIPDSWFDTPTPNN